MKYCDPSENGLGDWVYAKSPDSGHTFQAGNAKVRDDPLDFYGSGSIRGCFSRLGARIGLKDIGDVTSNVLLVGEVRPACSDYVGKVHTWMVSNVSPNMISTIPALNYDSCLNQDCFIDFDIFDWRCSISKGAQLRTTGACSWESTRSPKPPHKVQILALLPLAGVARWRKAAVT